MFRIIKSFPISVAGQSAIWIHSRQVYNFLFNHLTVQLVHFFVTQFPHKGDIYHIPGRDFLFPLDGSQCPVSPAIVSPRTVSRTTSNLRAARFCRISGSRSGVAQLSNSSGIWRRESLKWLPKFRRILVSSSSSLTIWQGAASRKTNASPIYSTAL